MEVKTPTRNTALPQLPADWVVGTIGELIERQIIREHLDGNHGELYPRSHEFRAYGVPYIGANDFVDGVVSFARC